MKIKYFGEIADIANSSSEDVLLEEATLEGLKSYLKTNYNLQMQDFSIAVNHEIVSKTNNFNLTETDEVAILSPFAGG